MIIDQLKWHAEAFKQLNASLWKVYDLILRKGSYYAGRELPVKYRKREPKRCFYNSRQLVLRSSSLVYCEGYCVGNDICVMFHHAWAVDNKGQVVDTTLANPEKYEFFGIVFDRSEIRPRKYVYTGMLCNEIESFRVDILKALDPEFDQEVAA